MNNGFIFKFEYLFKIKNNKWYKFKSIAHLNKVYYLSYNKMTNKYVVTDPVTLDKREYYSLFQAVQFIQRLYHFPLILFSQLADKKKKLTKIY